MHKPNANELAVTLGGSIIAAAGVLVLNGFILASKLAEQAPVQALIASGVALLLPIFAATRIAYRAGVDAAKRTNIRRAVDGRFTKPMPLPPRLEDRIRRFRDGGPN